MSSSKQAYPASLKAILAVREQRPSALLITFAAVSLIVLPAVDAGAALWTLAQPWYLQFPASRSHAGVTGADMCLPARRAASRIRSEFPALDAFDSLEYEDQGEAPRVRASVSSPVMQNDVKRKVQARKAS
eukprot:1142338-Pelagomonas_calceolata.AAC.2